MVPYMMNCLPLAPTLLAVPRTLDACETLHVEDVDPCVLLGAGLGLWEAWGVEREF